MFARHNHDAQRQRSCYNPSNCCGPIASAAFIPQLPGSSVSEIERTRTLVPSFTPPVRPDAILHDDEDAESPPFVETVLQREGLPPGFRMRHDAHYVDQLTTRNGAPQVRLIPLRDIDSARAVGARDVGALARSIGKHGVLQPLLVRPRAGRFDLIAGSHRLAAAAAAGLSEVPCVVYQVDDTRARTMLEAENLRAADEASSPPPPVQPRSDVPASALRELSQSFGAIGSCLHLLTERDTALRDRVALDLIRTEVHRAGRLVQCLHVIGQDASLADTEVSVLSAMEQVIDGFAAERRLSGIALQLEQGEGPLVVRGDAEWLAVGLSGAVGGMLALVQGAKAPTVTVRVAASSSGSSVTIELAQQSVSVPASAVARFFDVGWTDRAGGYQAAAELAAARKVAELHRGGAEIVPGDRGCRLVLVFPSA